MKTILHLLSLVSVASIPVVLAIETLNPSLPAGLGATGALLACGAALLALIVLGDYSRKPTLRARPMPGCRARSEKAAHPLAA